MEPANITKGELQLTISLAEVEQLRSENAALKKQVLDLQAENETLKKRLEAKKAPRPILREHGTLDEGMGM